MNFVFSFLNMFFFFSSFLRKGNGDLNGDLKVKMKIYISKTENFFDKLLFVKFSLSKLGYRFKNSE